MINFQQLIEDDDGRGAYRYLTPVRRVEEIFNNNEDSQMSGLTEHSDLPQFAVGITPVEDSFELPDTNEFRKKLDFATRKRKRIVESDSDDDTSNASNTKNDSQALL